MGREERRASPLEAATPDHGRSRGAARVVAGCTTRRGFTAAEVCFLVLILALAVIPIFDVFTRSYRTVFESKYAYMAQHVAREVAEELRQVPFQALDGCTHDWRAVGGHVLPMTPLRSAADRDDPGLAYPAPYRRIETRLTIEPLADEAGNPDKALKKAIIEIRWQENGPGRVRQQKVLRRFETIIANHRI